jgi:predicted Co/Zn/Cd cation transporter (cation efflux family)
LDAANPYGKTVYAFTVVEGWHVRYMLLLLIASILCSICVVAVATAVSQSLEGGLTAGSYALGIATILLSIMTFLSAVL